MSTWTHFVLNNVAEKMTPILQTPVEDIVYEILDRKGLPTRGEVRELKGRLDKLEQAVQGFAGSFDALKKDVAGAVERVAVAAGLARSAAEEATRAAAQADGAAASARSTRPSQAATPAPAPVLAEVAPAAAEVAPMAAQSVPVPTPKAAATPAPAVARRPRKAAAAPAVEAVRPRGRPRVAEEPCKVPTCDRPVRSKGFCAAHYQTWRRGRLDRFVSPDGLLRVDDSQLAVGSKFAGELAAIAQDGDEMVIEVGGKTIRKRADGRSPRRRGGQDEA